MVANGMSRMGAGRGAAVSSWPIDGRKTGWTATVRPARASRPTSVGSRTIACSRRIATAAAAAGSAAIASSRAPTAPLPSAWNARELPASAARRSSPAASASGANRIPECQWPSPSRLGKPARLPTARASLPSGPSWERKEPRNSAASWRPVKHRCEYSPPSSSTLAVCPAVRAGSWMRDPTRSGVAVTPSAASASTSRSA